MSDIREPNLPLSDLDDDDMSHISDLFFEKIVPKLKRLGARNGTLNCEFAGIRYRNWNIRFRSAGSGFDIQEFEYDEDGMAMDLDL